jgi:deazaflavin-dependent oxidoreductase (nitroreductase family)
MAGEGTYEPSRLGWVAEQVAEYEASGGTRANTLRDTGIPVIVVTMVGRRSGSIRKIALVRVERAGEYALIGSYGGRPEDPAWVRNLEAEPEVTIQDGPQRKRYHAREVVGDERADWFRYAESVYPRYAVYDAATTRVIRVFVASPA